MAPRQSITKAYELAREAFAAGGVDVEAAIARADAVLILGPGDPLAGRRFDKPILRGEVVPAFAGIPFKGMRATAFAGLGRPEKFFAMLRGLGVDLVATHAFPDHAAYPDAILRRLAQPS